MIKLLSCETAKLQNAVLEEEWPEPFSWFEHIEINELEDNLVFY